MTVATMTSGMALGSGLPKPGTASQVTSLVAASTSIQKVPKSLTPPLAKISANIPHVYWSEATVNCNTVTRCAFGDKHATKTVFLFGDSHAMMWLPAMIAVATTDHLKLILDWMPGCPAATVSVWDAGLSTTSSACDDWRAAQILALQKAHPFAILLASRTSNIPGADNLPIADSVWQAGLEQTIADLKSSSTKVAVIGDIVALDSNSAPCLAAYLSSVQSCSVPNPNPEGTQHFAAEKAAAAAENVMYLDPQSWLCTKTCSLIVGTMAVYQDQYHVTAVYAAFLSGVFTKALKSLLT
jgi:hypothetical protein